MIKRIYQVHVAIKYKNTHQLGDVCIHKSHEVWQSSFSLAELSHQI